MDKIDPVSRPSASERVSEGMEACVGQTLSGDEEITAVRQRSVSEGVVNSPPPDETPCVSLLKLGDWMEDFYCFNIRLE